MFGLSSDSESGYLDFVSSQSRSGDFPTSTAYLASSILIPLRCLTLRLRALFLLAQKPADLFTKTMQQKRKQKSQKRSVFRYNSQEKYDPGFLCDFQKKWRATRYTCNVRVLDCVCTRLGVSEWVGIPWQKPAEKEDQPPSVFLKRWTATFFFHQINLSCHTDRKQQGYFF